MEYDSTELDKLGTEREKLTKAVAINRPKLHAEILAAYDGGIGTVEIARRAKVTRDAVRQLLNKNGRSTKDAD